MTSKAFYSPTVSYSYTLYENWWNENCNPDPEIFSDYDCDGFDEYGYDKMGRDRSWHSRKDYDADPELYEQVKQDYQFLIQKIQQYC